MRVVKRISTSASPETVWRVLSDVEHWPDWTPTVLGVVPQDGPHLTAGARYRVTQPGLRPAIYEVSYCSANERFTWVQKVPGGWMIADHCLTPVTGGTEVELSFSSEGLLADIVAKLLARKIDNFVTTEANSLKKHCDNLSRTESSMADSG